MNDFGKVSMVIVIGFAITLMTAIFQPIHETPGPRHPARWIARVMVDFTTNGVLLGLMWGFKNLDYGSWALVVCIWFNMLEEAIFFFQVGPMLLGQVLDRALWNWADRYFRAAVVTVLAIALGSLLLLLSQILPPTLASNILSALACTGHRILTMVVLLYMARKITAKFVFSRFLPVLVIASGNASFWVARERTHHQLFFASALIVAKAIPPLVDAAIQGYVHVKRAYLLRKEMIAQVPSQVSLVPLAKVKAEGHGRSSMV